MEVNVGGGGDLGPVCVQTKLGILIIAPCIHTMVSINSDTAVST
jgi:hypothetical protein